MVALSRRALPLVTAAILLDLTSKAPAQTALSMRIRGEIRELTDNRLIVLTREGTSIAVTPGDPLTVSALRTMETSSIAIGNYVRVTAEDAPDGSLRALEVLVLPKAARGSAEMHFVGDLAPGSTMTSATTSAAVTRNVGRELTLTYRCGMVRVQVSPGVRVVTPVPAERRDLRSGAKVFLTVVSGADGTLTTVRVIVGKDGVDPPI